MPIIHDMEKMDMANYRLPDTPWHIGYVTKDEDDPRRHKARCVYNDGRKCRNVYMLECCGSAHCRFYAETEEDARKYREDMKIKDFRLFAGVMHERRVSVHDTKKENKNSTENPDNRIRIPKAIVAEKKKPRKEKKPCKNGVRICKDCDYYIATRGICSVTRTYRGYIKHCILYKKTKK